MGAWLRFRLYIDGKLVYNDSVDCETETASQAIEAISNCQMLLVELADEKGQLWMVECFDPDMPADQAYTRFGTDASMMTEPDKMTMPEIAKKILDRF